MDQTQILASFNAQLTAVGRNKIITEQRIADLKTLTQQLIKDRTRIKDDSEVLIQATAVLRELVAQIASKNLLRVEELVNTALSSIFTDMAITFKINTGVQRNNTSYSIALYQNGVEGNLKSFGGGVWAVVAFVLKAIFNILANRFRLIVMDESLAFVSEKYVIPCSQFIQELSQDLKLITVLVTHQPAFAEAADQVYHATADTGNAVKFTLLPKVSS